MSKKVGILLMIMVVAMVISCGASTPESSSPVKSDKTFYFLTANLQDPFYIPGIAGFTASGKDLGIKTEVVGPITNSLAEQLKTFEQLIANPITGGIYYQPVDWQAGEPLIEEAKAAGIPVVQGMCDSDGKARMAFIGSDNVILGNKAGAWIANLIGCQGTIGTIGNPGDPVLIRMDAMIQYIQAACPDVVIIPYATYEPTAASATAVLEAYLVAHPELTLIWAADGVSGQLSQVWKDKQDAGVKTLLLATDMPPATLQAVKDGVFVGTVGQDTYFEEYWGLQILYALSQGKRVPDTTLMAPILIDQSNVDQFIE